MNDGGLCEPCPSSGDLTLLFGLQFSFIGLYMLVLLFAAEELTDKMEFVLLNLRYAPVCVCCLLMSDLTFLLLHSVMWLVGAQQTYNLPEIAQQTLGLLQLFVNDMTFSNPACSGLSSQSSIFALNIGGKALLLF